MKYKDLYIEKQYPENEMPIQLVRLNSKSSDYYISPHWHDDFEMVHVISGELNLYINNTLIILKSGDVALINCRNIHRTEPKNCTYEYINFDLQIFKNKFSAIYATHMEPLQKGTISTVSIIPPEYRQINSAVKQLFTTLSLHDKFYELSTFTSLFVIFDSLFKANLIQESTITNKEIKQSVVVSNLMRWIEEKYTDDITLTILAEKAHLNKNYICKIFKESTGKTPIEYVNEIRIKNVCDELKKGKKSITTTALDNGYNDMSYFCKVFKKYMGITAKKYEMQLRNGKKAK